MQGDFLSLINESVNKVFCYFVDFIPLFPKYLMICSDDIISGNISVISCFFQTTILQKNCIVLQLINDNALNPLSLFDSSITVPVC